MFTACSLGPRVEALEAADASPLPSSGLPVVDGATLLQKIRESGHRGVVVNAWASWCDPCREELPMLARVAPQLAAVDVPLWLVSVDDPDGFGAARPATFSLQDRPEPWLARHDPGLVLVRFDGEAALLLGG